MLGSEPIRQSTLYQTLASVVAVQLRYTFIRHFPKFLLVISFCTSPDSLSFKFWFWTRVARRLLGRLRSRRSLLNKGISVLLHYTSNHTGTIDACVETASDVTNGDFHTLWMRRCWIFGARSRVSCSAGIQHAWCYFTEDGLLNLLRTCPIWLAVGLLGPRLKAPSQDVRSKLLHNADPTHTKTDKPVLHQIVFNN